MGKHTEENSNNVRLYYHKTDGGAEYLSPVAIPGTDEGAIAGAPFFVRLDGKPEFLGPPVALIDTAPELLTILRLIVSGYDNDGTKLPRDVVTARAAIAKAERRV